MFVVDEPGGVIHWITEKQQVDKWKYRTSTFGSGVELLGVGVNGGDVFVSVQVGVDVALQMLVDDGPDATTAPAAAALQVFGVARAHAAGLVRRKGRTHFTLPTLFPDSRYTYSFSLLVHGIVSRHKGSRDALSLETSKTRCCDGSEKYPSQILRKTSGVVGGSSMRVVEKLSPSLNLRTTSGVVGGSCMRAVEKIWGGSNSPYDTL